MSMQGEGASKTVFCFSCQGLLVGDAALSATQLGKAMLSPAAIKLCMAVCMQACPAGGCGSSCKYCNANTNFLCVNRPNGFMCNYDPDADNPPPAGCASGECKVSWSLGRSREYRLVSGICWL